MTSNDKQIDVLMRRYAKAGPRVIMAGHLDADELSTFAEGALPPATRAQFVSHLADCDDCRKRASDLAISSGALMRTEPSQSKVSESGTFWQSLAGIFALPVLRYAAFAAGLLIVAGVAFVIWQRPRQADLVAVKEPVNEQRESAAKPSAAFDDAGKQNKQANASTTAPSQLRADSDSNLKRDEALASEAATTPPPMKDAPAPVFAEKKAGAEVAKAAPAYAPPPPGETQNKVGTLQSSPGVSGPRQQQKIETVDKVAAQDRERDLARDSRPSDDAARKSAPATLAANQSAGAGRVTQEKLKGPSRNMESNVANRAANENRAEPPRAKREASEDRASTEEAQTRSVGGRKFRRQGNAWVDQKFKSSMSLKSITRGSDEFAALDSGLRSIAQQLGGQVIVVWKDKAYLIR